MLVGEELKKVSGEWPKKYPLVIGEHDIDLYALYGVLKERGGGYALCASTLSKRDWLEIARKLGVPGNVYNAGNVLSRSCTRIFAPLGDARLQRLHASAADTAEKVVSGTIDVKTTKAAAAGEFEGEGRGGREIVSSLVHRSIIPSPRPLKTHATPPPHPLHTHTHKHAPLLSSFRRSHGHCSRLHHLQERCPLWQAQRSSWEVQDHGQRRGTLWSCSSRRPCTALVLCKGRGQGCKEGQGGKSKEGRS